MGDGAVSLRRRCILQAAGAPLLFFENWRAY